MGFEWKSGFRHPFRALQQSAGSRRGRGAVGRRLLEPPSADIKHPDGFLHQLTIHFVVKCFLVLHSQVSNRRDMDFNTLLLRKERRLKNETDGITEVTRMTHEDSEK